MKDEIALTRVTGRPYQIHDGCDQWLVYASSASHSLKELVARVAGVIAPRPCAVQLRVYGEAANSKHIMPMESVEATISLLKRCEAVGIFDSEDQERDAKAVLGFYEDPSMPGDDEALLLGVVRPRPVLFLHAGHEDIDVVLCGRADAQSMVEYLFEHEYP